jgi:hypothetical protein
MMAPWSPTSTSIKEINMTKIKLTTTQETVLNAAAQREDGSIQPMPKNIKGGAALKVITALENKGLIYDAAITPPYKTWLISDDGYRAIGQEPPALETSEEKPAASFEKEITEAEQALGIAPATDKKKTTTKLRQGTKQAKVIEMLKRPEGATIDQIAEETAWKNHTIRGFFAGTIKKKFGLELTKNKRQPTEHDQKESQKFSTSYHLAG